MYTANRCVFSREFVQPFIFHVLKEIVVFRFSQYVIDLVK